MNNKSTQPDQDLLKVGDMVNWSGSFGTEKHKPACVTDIEITKGDKYGYAVNSVPWLEVYGRNIVVGLSNGHWAYASQIKKRSN